MPLHYGSTVNRSVLPGNKETGRSSFSNSNDSVFLALVIMSAVDAVLTLSALVICLMDFRRTRRGTPHGRGLVVQCSMDFTYCVLLMYTELKPDDTAYEHLSEWAYQLRAAWLLLVLLARLARPAPVRSTWCCLTYMSVPFQLAVLPLVLAICSMVELLQVFEWNHSVLLYFAWSVLPKTSSTLLVMFLHYRKSKSIPLEARNAVMTSIVLYILLLTAPWCAKMVLQSQYSHYIEQGILLNNQKLSEPHLSVFGTAITVTRFTGLIHVPSNLLIQFLWNHNLRESILRTLHIRKPGRLEEAAHAEDLRQTDMRMFWDLRHFDLRPSGLSVRYSSCGSLDEECERLDPDMSN